MFRHDEKGYGSNKRHRGGWPDTDIWNCDGQYMAIEFKLPGQKLSKVQEEKRKTYEENNVTWKTFENIDEAMLCVIDFCFGRVIV